MKILSKIAALIILALLTSKVQGQTNICVGTSTVLVALNSAGLTNPAYSLNPGGISSSNPSFVVTPTTIQLPNVPTIYTLYVTGTNTNAQTITTTNTVSFLVVGVTFSVTSPQNFTLGCASNSVAALQIINASSAPASGSPLSYSFFPPGQSTVMPLSGALGNISNTLVSVPGIWSIAVRDNSTTCTDVSTVVVTNGSPFLGVISGGTVLTCSSPTTVIQTTTLANVQFNWLPSQTQGNSVIVTPNSFTATQQIAETLTLQAIDTTNFCMSDTVIVIYQNLFPPRALFSGSASAAVCTQSLTLTNQSKTGSGNPMFGPLPVIAALWEGPAPQATLANSTTYVARTSGIYTMTGIDLNSGCSSTTTTNINLGQRPLAAFMHTVTNGVAVFADASTGTANSTLYYWEFGDGSTSIARNPTHAYLGGGAHLVKLKVRNLVDCVDSIIQSVNVTGISCAANSNFSMIPTGTAQVWNVVPSYPWNVSAARWDWGDGSSSNTLYTSHQYSAAGLYSICLSVTVSCVASSSTCSTYSVYKGASPESFMIEVNVLSPELISGLVNDGAGEQFNWNISPNPTSDEFTLNLTNDRLDPLRFSIQDLTGRVLHEERIESGLEAKRIVVSSLPLGVYLVTLESATLKSTKRVVISR